MSRLSALKTMADRVLAREGQDVTVYFVDTTSTDYDPGSLLPPPAPIAPTAVASKAVFLDFALLSNGAMVGNNTLIEKGDNEVYLQHATGFPRAVSPSGDYIIDNKGTKWRVVLVKSNNPSGSLEIMYKLMVRR